MVFFRKIILFLMCGGLFFLSTSSLSAFLGEDLGLDIYKNIDEGLYDLEIKQYQYELTGQGRADVSKVVNSILASEGIKCDIQTIKDIEDIVGGSNPIGIIQLRCNDGEETLSTDKVAAVQKKISNIKTTFSQRAENKSQKIYEIARIGLYSDGVSENSPFDLITDLEEIDRVIFSEPIEYNGEAWPIGDEELIDFLNEDKSYLDDEEEEDTLPEEEEEDSGEEDDDTSSEEDDIPDEERDDRPIHEYACLPPDQSGLNPDEFDDIDDYIYDPLRPRRPDIPIIEDEYEVITDGEYSNGASWGGPFRGRGPNSGYTGVNDAWNCDSFFCITIEFVIKNQDLLGGGQTVSIESILKKASEHVKKFANTSLVQSKMTTNNFELGLIIPDLSEMLRGLGVQVQTKPAPILNLEKTDSEKATIEGDKYKVKNLATIYYKNLGLDYDRRNDLDIHEGKVLTKKILESCSELPHVCAIDKQEELEKFEKALAKSNAEVSQSIDKKALYEDTGDFYKQFVELERFVGSINDFSTSLSGLVHKMKKIPKRTKN